MGPGDQHLRRGVLDLLHVLKNADYLTGFTGESSSVDECERIDRAVAGCRQSRAAEKNLAILSIAVSGFTPALGRWLLSPGGLAVPRRGLQTVGDCR
ncbi:MULTISPECIES: hypothetical protein [unclassified Streptomyces]|uniref:hypothetical protein n=1 Tax=unclassified Streptomyces TaxID=2593676 RepID=UPI003450C485